MILPLAGRPSAPRATPVKAMNRLAALLVLVVLSLKQVFDSLDGLLSHPGYSDFGSYYLYARVGLHHGWSALYDLAVQRQEWVAMGGAPVIPWWPIIYPPPLAWLAAPFTLVPLPVAHAIWTALLFGLILLTWQLLISPATALTRWTALAAAFAIYPVMFALVLGQVLLVELAAVAGAWWCLQRRRDVLAGLLLVALVFKPQVAFLVPVALLATGRWKTFVSWLGGSVIVAAVALLTTGPDGIHAYASRLQSAAGVPPEFVVPTYLTLEGTLGHGLLARAVEVAVAGLTIAIAYRYRRTGVSIPIAAALVGSIVITPYLHQQDQATLLVAGALALRAGVTSWPRHLLVAGYLLLVAISYFGPFGGFLGPLLLIILLAWLGVVLAASYSRGGGAQRRLRPVPVDGLA
jgi:hypothetical protein